MARRPDNYGNIRPRLWGDYQNLPPGGYVLRIVKAETTRSKSGKEMLVVYFDIAEGEYEGFYRRRFDNSTRDNKKWQGVIYQVTEGSDFSLESFAGLISVLEDANPGFIYDDNDYDLPGKIFGGVFGEEEYTRQDGKIGTSVKCVGYLAVDKVRAGDFEIPSKKTLNQEPAPPPAQSAGMGYGAFGYGAGAGPSVPAGFSPIEDVSDDDLPF